MIAYSYLVEHIMAATFLVLTTACLSAFSYFFFSDMYKENKLKEEMEFRREIGRYICMCSDWVRPTDNAQIMVLAVGDMLEHDYSVYGGNLKFLYEKRLSSIRDRTPGVGGA